MNTRTVSLYLILLMIVSVPALANAEQTTPNISTQIQSKNPEKNPAQVTRHLEISFSESVGIASNDQPPANQQNTNQKVTPQNKMVSLSEVVTISSNDNNANFILIKPNVVQVTTLDRIWNPERIRIIGRTITVDNQISYDMPNGKLYSPIDTYPSSVHNAFNFAQIENLFSVVTQSGNNLFSYKPTGLPFIQSNLLQNKIIGIDNPTTQNENPILILLLIPVAGYVLIRSSKNKIQTRSKQILSFCFCIIIISSIVTTPLSISAYWLAYAQNQQNDSNQSNSSSSNISFNGYSNLTNLSFNGHSNLTNLSFNGHSNSTSISFNGYSNLTNLSFNGNSNSTNLSFNSNSNSTAPAPSWQLSQNSTTVNSPTVTNNGTTVQLNGKNFLRQQVNSTRTLSALTISAWVKPDYSQGSPQFTVISKQNQFILGINNIIPPQKFATFSVYDGIRWDTVNSTVPIQQSWTHLAGTFNGSSISIYVNGTLQSTYHLGTIPTVTVNGTLTTKTVDNISSPSDIVIGAYLNTLRTQTSNLFSGSVQSVKLYDSLLSPSQIALLYTSNPLSQTPLIPNQLPQIKNKSLNLTDSVLTSDSISQSVSSKQSTQNKLLNLVDSVLLNDTVSQSLISKQSAQGKLLSLTDLLTINDAVEPSTHMSFNGYSNSTQLATPNKLLSMTESLVINDIISQNSTSQDTLQSQTITPELNSTKQTYLITETPELQFKYLSDSAILKTTEKKITKELAQLNTLEQKLNNTEALLNVTQTVHLSKYDVLQQSDLTKQQIVNAQQQINDARHEIIQAQQKIEKALAQPQNHAEVDVAIDKVLNVTQTLNQTRHQVIEAAEQMAQDRKDIKSQADQITQLSANITSDQGTVQQGSWHGQNETITVQVKGPDNNTIQVQPTVEKVLDGKFNISLSSTRDARPGIYKVDITMIKDGNLYTAHDQFAWGLVSVNTMKSIYKPGEQANLVIVVLDNGGHSVCNSNVIMNIHDPSSGITTLTTGHGITPESQCGLYDAKYTTKSAGNYTIDVAAQNPSGVATFSTSFLVQSSYPFDVIRTADSKIDPVDNPNLFNVRLDFTSYSNATNLSIKESVPSAFNLTTDGAVQTIGDSKTITWNKDLIGNKTFVQYTYSVPLEYPRLYALGPVQINYGTNSTFTEARPWFVAVDPQPYVTITLTNCSTCSATPVPFQQKIVFNPSKYSSIEAANLGNIRFCADSACNTQLYSWLENCTPSSCTNSATSATAWVQLRSAIPGSGGTLPVYMVFQPTSTNFDQLYWGRAAWIGGGTYGQYDNGRKVFTLYDNFTGTTLNSTKWTKITSYVSGCSGNNPTVTVNNGITFSSATKCDFEFIVSPMFTYPLVAEANMTTATNNGGTSGVDPMMGVTNSTLHNNYVAPYSGYSIDNCISPCGTGLSLVRESSNVTGSIGLKNNAVGFTKGIWNMTWTAVGNEKASDGNIVQSSTDSINNKITNYGIFVGQSNNNPGTNSAQMARMRACLLDSANNCVMPSTSLGGVNFSVVLSETLTATDSLSPSGISVDNVQSNFGTNISSLTIPNFAVGSGKNRLLLVGIGYRWSSPGLPTVSSVTWGSNSLTQIINEPNPTSTGQKETSAIWGLLNPAASTSNTITVNLSGSTGSGDDLIIGAISFFGVDQSGLPSNSAGNGATTGATVSVPITTTAANSLLFDVAAHNGAGTSCSTLTAQGGQVQQWNACDSSGGKQPTVAASTLSTTTIGSYTMSWAASPTTNSWTDAVVELKPSHTVTFSDTITASDSLSTAATKKTTLSTETVAVTDSLSTGATKKTTLPESLSITDSLSTAATKKATLSTESVSITASLSTTATKTTTLPESLSITDSLSTAATKKATLSTESVSITDSLSTTATKTATLPESLSITDSLSTAATKKATLSTESVSITASLSKSVGRSATLPESLSITDSLSTAATKKATLSTESVSITDQVSTAATKKTTLSESVSITDQISTAAAKTKTLSETVTVTDQSVSTNAAHQAQVSSILIDHIQTANGTGTQIKITSFTVTNDANRYLLVGISTNGATVSSVSYGASSLASLISKSNTGVDTELWGLVNPPSGTADITVNLSSSGTVAAGAYELMGVDQNNPIPTTASGTSGTSGGGNPQVPITNQYASSLVIDTETKLASSLSTSSPQIPSWNNQVGTTLTGASSYIIPYVASTANTFLWTASANGPKWTGVAVEVKASGVISPSERVHVTDTLTTSATKKATLSTESVSIADSLSESVGRSAILSETISITDSKSTAATKKATLSETVTATDQTVTLGAGRFAQPPPQTVTITDSLSESVGRSAILSETVSITDSKSTVATKTNTLSESVSLTDQISTAATKKATLSTESVSIADSLSTGATKTKSLSESVTIADQTVSTAATKKATLSESVSITDSLSTAATKKATLSTESVSITDSLSKSVGRNVTQSESVSITDSLSTGATKTKTLSESVSITDQTVSTAATKTKTLSETVTANDNLSTAATKTKTLSESVSITDSLSTGATKTKSLSESLSITDQISTAATKTKTLSESVSITDSLSTAATKKATLSTESISIADSLSTGATKTKALSESVTIADQTVSTVATKTKALSESVSITDQVSTAATKKATLSTESVSITDQVSTAATKKATLSTESLSITDSVSTVATKTKALSTESVSITDQVSTAATKKATLSTESLSITDSVSTTATKTKALSESVSITDQVSTAATKTKTLSETVTASDNLSTAATKTKTLSTESVSITDQVSTAATKTKTLSTESVSITDQVSTAATKKATLLESVTIADQTVSTAATKKVTLSETVTIADQLSTAATKKTTLSEAVTITDQTVSTAATKKATLSESVSITDSLSTAATKKDTLSETVTVTDSISTAATKKITLSEAVTSQAISFGSGELKIEARDQNGVLVPSAAYTILPNPNGGTGSMTVSDGGINDNDGINEGRVVVNFVPLGSYNVTMTTIPAGYNVLGNSTIITVDNTNLNGTSIFRVVPTTFNLSNMPATATTSSPNLNSTTLSTWMSSYNPRIFNGTQPATQITSVNQLPPIISAGNANQAAINLAKAHQATVKLDTNFVPQTDAASIIKTLGVPPYSMPKSSLLVTVIPSIVAQAANLNIPTQTVTTPPLDKIVPGQEMIIPVNTGTIPNSGGLKGLDIQSKSTATSTGNPPSDWFVIKANNQLPSYTPPLPQNDNLILYANVTYQHEQTNTGFDWSNPANFAAPPRLTLQVPKNPSGIQVDSSGCPISDIFLYDPSTAKWTTNAVSIISSTPSSDNTNTCDVIVQTPHFSQIGLAGHSVGGGASAGTSSGTSGGTAVVGLGPSGAGGSGGAFGGILTSQLKVYQVSYDVCQNGTVTILVGYTGNNPTVFLRTSLTGVVPAQLAAEQPYAQDNVKSTLQKLVYIAQIDKREQSFEVVALQAAGGNINSVGRTIDVTGCKGTINLENPRQIQPAIIDLSAPRLFDLKVQLVNGTKIPSDITSLYVNSEPLKVYGIVYSPSTIDRAELRFVKTGSPSDQYTSVKMEMLPLISNTTYTVSAMIPKEMVTDPAMTYWIDVHNTAQKTTDSDQYSIGVKPDYNATGKLEMDIRPTRAGGTTAQSSAYFTNNSTGPLYGTISLLVDGNVVYTSPAQLFGKGQTRVDLAWKTSSTEYTTGHQVQAVAQFYGKPLLTGTTTVLTFPASKSIPLSNMVPIETIYNNNNMVAKASVLYSSFKNEGTMRFKVTAPDGTCVIGGSADCLVPSSTMGLPGNIKSVIIEDHVYRVRYSGPDSPLERFSITSVDPILGPWKVEIDSQTGLIPQAQAMGDVFLKVNYRDFDTSLITVPSQ